MNRDAVYSRGGERGGAPVREGSLVRGFLMAEGALYALFLAMDLWKLGRAGDPVKFCSILLCAAFCLYWGRRGGDGLVAGAMALTLCADFLLLVLDRDYALGVAIFCLVQGLYFLRLCRSMGRRPRWLLRGALFLLGMGALWGLGCLTALNTLAIFYFTNFVGNTLAALEVPGSRGRLFALGLGLFLCCDLCVGARNAPELLPQWAAGAVQVGMWLFYLPGQVLIALSALPDSALRGLNHEKHGRK